MLWDKDLEKDSPAYKFASDESKIIRVIAGPGAGKSFALQRRIMRLIEKEKVSPERILVITYSKVAAEYLKEDIRKIGIDASDKIMATTLHGICYNLIDSNRDIAPIRYLRTMHPFEQKAMLYDLNMEYGSIREKEEKIRTFETELETDALSDEEFNKDVQEWLKSHHAMLFGEIITQTIKYLEENPSCPERNMFDHVLVDEYQDLNITEQKVIDLISSNGSLVVIGDDDQSIYSFKHAHPDGIRRFHETHIGCRDHLFEECRRCPKTVVEMALRLIANNKDRAQKEFVSYKDNQIGEIATIVSETDKDEAIKIAKMIKDEIEGVKDKEDGEKEIRLNDFLVLAPTQVIAEDLQAALKSVEITSVKSFFKESILKSDPLKKAFSMLNQLANPDDMVSLRYLLGQGGDKLRSKSYRRVLTYASEHGMTVAEVLEKATKKEITIPNAYKLIQVYSDILCQLETLKAAITHAPMDLANILTENIFESDNFKELLNIAINRNRFSLRIQF